MRGRTGRRIDGGLVLLLTPILWGATFPATKIGLRHLTVLSMTAWSRVLGVLTILALLPLLKRAGGGPDRRWREALAPGAILGALMFGGYLVQTEGLARTTATNAGFITGLYVVFTPLLAMLLFGQRAPRAAWTAIAI